MRVVLAAGLGRLLWWRPRAIAAGADGLVLERRGGDEHVPWADLDAIVDGAPIRIEARGRVIARLPAGGDDDAIDALLDAAVARAGLEWVEPSSRRGRRGLPRMAVRPAVAARLRSGHPPPAG